MTSSESTQGTLRRPPAILPPRVFPRISARTSLGIVPSNAPMVEDARPVGLRTPANRAGSSHAPIGCVNMHGGAWKCSALRTPSEPYTGAHASGEVPGCRRPWGDPGSRDSLTGRPRRGRVILVALSNGDCVAISHPSCPIADSAIPRESGKTGCAPVVQRKSRGR